MTRDRGLPLLLGLLMAYGLFVAECRYHQREDATTTKTEVKHHRHRHRHEPANRRSHHDLAARSWQEVDYEYDGDSEEPIDDYEDDYVLRSRSYYEHPRSHQRAAAARRSYHHGRMFEPRYPARYHAGSGSYYARYDGDGDDRRRTLSSRYKARNHHYRPSGRTYHTSASYPRSRDFDEDDDDETEEDYDYERLPYGHAKNDGADKRHEWWRNSKRRAPYRKNWRSKVYDYPRGARRHRLEDREGIIDRGGDASRWTDNWRRGSNSSELKYHFSKDDEKAGEDEDYEDHGGLEEGDKDEDEDDVWKDIDDDEDAEEDEEEEEEEEEEGGEEDLGRDFYKSEAKPLLRTYDDIIRRLTSDEPTTQRAAVKRNYRNIETDKRDGYNRELKYETRNVSRPADLLKYAGSTRHAAAATASNYFLNKRIAESPSVKSVAGGSGGRKPPRNAIGAAAVKGNDRQQQRKSAAAVAKTDDTHAKTKSLEQDYDEYPNGPDNEREDELVKAGVEEDSGMQADVTNTDYADDENETSVNTLATTNATTIATTTTTTTTTTPKSLVKQRYDYRDSRVYESGTTGAQYNGYQAKNDYPPMSAHSMHKWRSLGTPEGVRETRNNMQQYNKNGKSAELREALQHARKVNKEGSCQWPRARVIQVRDIYPSPSTTYIPHCAILHRCSDDTGCCRSEALTCVPKHTDRVELSFYTTSVGGANVVAKLAFYNHTECECKERSEYDAANERPETSDHRVYRHYQTPSPPPQNMKKPPRKPCRCPSDFTPRITPDGVCQCNCYESNQNCIKTRRGKAFLSVTDRMCIQSNECAMPNCEFGVYVKLPGRCPRKKDTFDALSDYHNNLNHRFKS